ncbi:MAG: exo-beta-N-acetylmuramidase NamZ domain-containing protein [Planctomycetota bacterium]|nr:exo-beta-N-acetylmuramidase NamZ domain-containing protein [Planctomycetota bacterium]
MKLNFAKNCPDCAILLVFSSASMVLGLSWASAQSDPERLGSEAVSRIGSLVEAAIAKGEMAGGVVAAGGRNGLFYLEAFGHLQVQPEKRPMKVDALFDLASLTKPLATAACCMKLLEEGRIQLDDPVSKHLPEFTGRGKEAITVKQLLTHQGGLIADNSLRDYEDGREEAYRNIDDLKLVAAPGEKFIYTDVGFIVLGRLVERLSGCPLDEACRRYFWEPAGMQETCFNPDASLRRRAAVTEKRDGRWIQGVVHDPRASHLNGVAGHAGMFSTASDLARFAQMLLAGGTIGGQPLIEPETIEVMTADYPVSRGIRGLGWDKQTGYSSNRAAGLSRRAFGHGGFTGTGIWIDPELNLFYIFLGNRLHPDGKGSVNRLIGEVGQVVVEAITQSRRGAVTHGGSLVAKTGLDVLREQEFAAIRGKRVGLITNQTGLTRDGDSNIEIFSQAEQVKLVRVFSPEHGLRGILDQSQIGDSKTLGEELEVVSLYGDRRRPEREQLQDLDALLFDIQDIGTRFYTYISTMQYAMQSAAENGVEFIVLDRPNPIGGHRVAGPLLDAEQLSFVGCHPLPVRHGMTVGELARLFAAEMKLDLKLTVVPIQGWQRDQYYDETGLPWVNPSPNMRNLNQALLYPGIGLLEFTNVSVGRGTDTPFEILGAPWMDGRLLSRRLNSSGLQGVQFMPRSFTPNSSKYSEQVCQGVSLTITDRARIEPLRIGFEVAIALRDEFPQHWDAEKFNRLLGNKQVFQAFQQGASWQQAEQRYRSGLEEFQKRRAKYLMYD